MNDKLPKLETAYVERKRHQLAKLRDELRKTTNFAEATEGEIKNESQFQPREFEDDAQKLDMLEKEGLLVQRNAARLTQVERALAKIDEGTYGYSDVSGQRIPDDRLDAIPEATKTLAEQGASERS